MVSSITPSSIRFTRFHSLPPPPPSPHLLDLTRLSETLARPHGLLLTRSRGGTEKGHKNADCSPLPLRFPWHQRVSQQQMMITRIGVTVSTRRTALSRLGKWDQTGNSTSSRRRYRLPLINKSRLQPARNQPPNPLLWACTSCSCPYRHPLPASITTRPHACRPHACCGSHNRLYPW